MLALRVMPVIQQQLAFGYPWSKVMPMLAELRLGWVALDLAAPSKATLKDENPLDRWDRRLNQTTKTGK
jgi:hypothetical protein